MYANFTTRLTEVRARIDAAAARSGRSANEVTLIAVTKGHPIDAMIAARAAGIVDLGENRVQEALPKLEFLDPDARVHLLGQLQTNKVNKAVGRFASIMAVDRAELLDRIARRAEELEVVQPIWIQVNASGEAQKAGCHPDETVALWDRARTAGSLRALGLMTMARFEAPDSELRATFACLRALALSLEPEDGRPRVDLSMGMSDDFEIAIEEGATHVRVGTALFGPRD